MSKVYKHQVGGDHYQSMVIQPSEFINKNNIPFAEGNALKYLCRHKKKEEAEKEKKELEESYQESKKQAEERKSKEWNKGYDKWKENK